MSFMSELDIRRQQAGITPIPSILDTMRDEERAIQACLGPAFWVEDGAIGVIDNRSRVQVDEMLHDAARTLDDAGYCVTYRRVGGLAYGMRIWGQK